MLGQPPILNSPQPLLAQHFCSTFHIKFSQMRPALSKLSVPLFSPAVSSILVLACLLACSQHQVEAKQVQLPVDIQRSPDPEMMDQQKPGLHSTVYMPPPSAPIINADQQPAVRANRVKRQHVHDNSGFSIRVLIELLFCFFLPPAAVALHGGAHFQLHIVLNVVLCVLGWVPGILHAIWYCFMSGF